MSDELEKLTVSALKDLARKHLGKGFSRLRSKADLLIALKEAIFSAAGGSARKEHSAVPSIRAAEVTRFPKMPKTNGQGAVTPVSLPSQLAAKPNATTEAQVEESTPARGTPMAGREARPVEEGFFVVRVAGAVEAERHHLTESSGAPRHDAPPPGGFDEQLGELPDVYENDAELLLPRDPHTLFFLWDYTRDTRQGAMAGLRNPHARLRVYDGDQIVRELDFALESRSYYIHGLTPGRSYRVEAWFVGEDGQLRQLARGSNVIALPSEGPSENLEVRFMRIPWDVPLARVKDLLRQHRESQTRVTAPARVPLPSSQSSRELVPGEAPPVAPNGFRWVPSRSGRP